MLIAYKELSFRCDAKFVPKESLVNFTMTGMIPKEINILTRLEISMVSLCNPVMSISIMPSSMQKFMKRYCCTIVKDINDVALKLPRHLDMTEVAVLRAAGKPPQDVHAKDLQFRPTVVLVALRWLKANNPMYAHVVVEDASFDNPSFDDFEDVDPLTLDVDDVTELNGALHNVGDGVSTPSAESSFSEVLLLQTPETTNTEESLQNNLGNDPNVRKRSNSALGPLFIDLETSSTFVHPMTDELYYELGFPNLFPYGRGGPGNIHNLSVMEHARAMLRRGSIYGKCHRIFQTHPPYYFTVYAHSMRQKVGGIDATIASSAPSTGNPTNLRGQNEIGDLDEEDEANLRHGASQVITRTCYCFW
jgi:hypothetical protein